MKLKPKYILILFVLVNLIAGVFVVSDFGVSTDEPNEVIRSNLSKEIYSTEINLDQIEAYENLGIIINYGTASSTLIRFIEETFFPEYDHRLMVVSHYCYFVLFQAAVVGLYLLGKHFFNGFPGRFLEDSLNLVFEL